MTLVSSRTSWAPWTVEPVTTMAEAGLLPMPVLKSPKTSAPPVTLMQPAATLLVESAALMSPGVSPLGSLSRTCPFMILIVLVANAASSKVGRCGPTSAAKPAEPELARSRT